MKAIGSVLAVATLAGSCSAGVVVESVFAECYAETFGTLQQQRFTSTALGAWDAHAYWTDDAPNDDSWAESTVATYVDMGVVAIDAAVAGYDLYPFGGGGKGYGGGRVTAIFTTDSPLTVQGVSSGANQHDRYLTYGVRLDVETAPGVFSTLWTIKDSSLSYTVNPGRYRAYLWGFAGASGSGTGGTTGTYTGRMMLPAPSSLAILAGLLVARRRR